MDSKTKKIALACFIGGVLFGTTAFCVAPAFLWLGILAGAAGGYVSYEFRGVLRAAVEAWQAVKADKPEPSGSMIKFLCKPRPFAYPSFFIATGLAYLLIHYGLIVPGSPAWSFGYLVGVMILWGVLWYLFFSVIILVSLEGDVQLPVATYGKAFGCFARGLGRIVLFFIWTIWKKLVIGAWWLLRTLGSYLKFLFISIHSDERLLCAFDGTLGGIIAYLWLGPSAEVFAAKAAVVVFGGVIGAGLGVLNYELVSKKWLKLVPQE